MLAAKPAKVLPAHDSEKDLAENFSQFFSDKVKEVKDEQNSLSTSVSTSSSTGTDDVTPFNKFCKEQYIKNKKSLFPYFHVA